MLQSISWQQYFTCIILVTILYYLFVWIVFYKGKLSLLPGLGRFGSFHQPEQYEPEDILTTAQHVTDELSPVFDGRTNKNELILALQLQLHRYNGWEEPGFRDTVNAFIVSESQTKCSIRLGEEDLRALWK